MTSLASQGEMNTFIKEKAAARKTILANFLDLDVFDKIYEMSIFLYLYLAHVIEQPNLRIPNPQYLQLNFCFDFFNDSENTF